ARRFIISRFRAPAEIRLPRNGARHQSEIGWGCFSCDEQWREDMENFSDHIVAYGIWTVVVIVLIFLVRMANVIRYIPNNQVGIVEKLWAARGSIKSGFIALHGEAGFQPEILRGGIHFFFPFTYRIHKSDLVTVGQGKIAYVFARDGAPLAPSQVLAANDVPERAEFQDVRQFLSNGGQKGPQRKILREGTYAI